MGPLILLLTGLTGAAAGYVYLRHERLGPAGVGLTVLRTLGIAGLLLLLWDPVRAMRERASPPTVLLDASLSMAAAGGRWREALDSARSIGEGGTILRFGSGVAAFDSSPPGDGLTRLAEALRVARARGGPVVAITDGEVDDLAAIDRGLLAGLRVAVLPRRSVPNGSLVEVAVPNRIGAQDTVRVQFGVQFTPWAGADSARVEVMSGARRLAGMTIPVSSGGFVRRSLALPPRSLGTGEHVLRVRLSLDGDAEPRDDERLRVLTVTAEPAVAILAAPAHWEARFFATELGAIVRAPVYGFSLVRPGQWVDMRTLAPVPEPDVQRAARAASLVVTFGFAQAGEGTRALWRWRGADTTASLFAGEWYVSREVPPSPVAGQLGGVRWDSVPPLTGIVPVVPAVGSWTALTARLGRRGVERPVLVGRDSAGARQLDVTGDGLWRWSLRGGAAREAYRAVLAGGVDWLLGSGRVAGTGVLTAPSVTHRGAPIPFRWGGVDPPDSATVRLSGARETSLVLRFDGDGQASTQLDPGVYRWTLHGAAPSQAPRAAGGTLVVEEYSDEFRTRAATLEPAPGSGGVVVTFRRTRDRLWLFGLVAAMLVGEWAWRFRRGLP